MDASHKGEVLAGISISERDRALVAQHLSVAGATTVSGKGFHKPREPQQGRSPRKNFVKHGVPRLNNMGLGSGGLVTVPSDTVLKEWSSVKGEMQDRFKSPALFWEIRMKETKPIADESEKAVRPTTLQLMHSCDIFEQYCERAENAGDSVMTEIKEQVFTALFADYLGKVPQGRSRLDHIQSCVPYYIVVERLFEEKASLEKRVQDLERHIDGNLSRGKKAAETQTLQEDMDQSTGVTVMKKQIRDLHEEVEHLEAALFDERLEAQEFKAKSEQQAQSLKETLDKFEKLEAEARQKYEAQRASAEMLKDQLEMAIQESDTLKKDLKEEQSQANTQKLMFESKVDMIMNTLNTERERFKQERSDWLESFVGERYEWLTTVQSMAVRAEHEKALAQVVARGAVPGNSKEQDKEVKKVADRANRGGLWESLRQVDTTTRSKLEGLYSQSLHLVNQDTDTHNKLVREALREQEQLAQSVMIEAPQLHSWYTGNKQGRGGRKGP